jgi:hypothetical protein
MSFEPLQCDRHLFGAVRHNLPSGPPVGCARPPRTRPRKTSSPPYRLPSACAPSPRPLFYGILNRVVDGYGPVADELKNAIDEIEPEVLGGTAGASHRTCQLSRRSSSSSGPLKAPGRGFEWPDRGRPCRDRPRGAKVPARRLGPRAADRRKDRGLPGAALAHDLRDELRLYAGAEMAPRVPVRPGADDAGLRHAPPHLQTSWWVLLFGWFGGFPGLFGLL